jgi:dipeptidase E
MPSGRTTTKPGHAAQGTVCAKAVEAAAIKQIDATPGKPSGDYHRAVMQQTPRLIAIGGGGFTHGSDATMEDFILAQSVGARSRVGFIGTASGDEPDKVRRFHARFAGNCAQHEHLPEHADAGALSQWLQRLDIVYVGGGNTLRLLTRWRELGWDTVLVDAARRGVLMAGVSAGANAWFARALSDASGLGLAPISGLGLVPGSCCPHYSTEPQRQPVFHDCIARGELPDGFAIDDGAAVVIGDGPTALEFSARPGAHARILRRQGDAALSEPLPPHPWMVRR